MLLIYNQTPTKKINSNENIMKPIMGIEKSIRYAFNNVSHWPNNILTRRSKARLNCCAKKTNATATLQRDKHNNIFRCWYQTRNLWHRSLRYFRSKRQLNVLIIVKLFNCLNVMHSNVYEQNQRWLHVFIQDICSVNV